MANNQSTEQRSALHDEIKRRNISKFQQEAQQRQLAGLQGSAPTGPAARPQPPVTPSPATNAAKPAGATLASPPQASHPAHIQPIVSEVAAARKPFQNLTKRAKLTLSLVGLAAMLVIVLAGSLATAVSESSGETPVATFADLPLSNIDTVINHLKELGVPVSDISRYDLTNTQIWQDAQEGYQFTVKRNQYEGKFILFGYANADKASADVFDVMTRDKYKSWGIYNFSNIILLSAPGSADAIKSEMVSHLTQFLSAPYRAFWPTSTPVPTATPKPTTAAPATASR